ncbi:polyphosphate polymerase domain-containing protein [Alkalibacillus aidingensis]|uniref:polyphosphate polymerase domain-containing protein n=1 Tax=Alkalibacillus aidingensis TaxID=2747607 RepID=UPI0016615892|nr:polyphosphate polymerase domain-containing protein [Alkalibacillus aidingensis]
MDHTLFNRYEFKYLITSEQYHQFREEIKSKLTYDPYGDELGRYHISSLYFDSDDYKLYQETRQNVRRRQKLRLRIYNHGELESLSFFELKQKYKNVINKRRTNLPLTKAYDFVDHMRGRRELDYSQYEASDQKVLNEIHCFQSVYGLKPTVIVSYDRQAFLSIDNPTLRVTFDYNLKCRNDDLRIENDLKGTPLVHHDLIILEVKVSGATPFWLTKSLSEFKCKRQGVSKYCTSVDVIRGISNHHKIL